MLFGEQKKTPLDPDLAGANLEALTSHMFKDTRGTYFLPPLHWKWVLERELLLLHFQTGCTARCVVDVGTNNGVYSLFAAIYGSQVFAFEVQPQVFQF